MADRIRLAGMRFFTIVGDLPHERTDPQPVEVDLEAETDLAAPAAADDLAEGLDYRALYRAAATVVGDGEGPRLLETLAERIAHAALAVDGVERVVVRCRKPWAALPGPVDRVEVEVRRP